MTLVGFTVGGTSYDQYVFSADLWRDSLAGIGRWEVLLDPLSNSWSYIAGFEPDTWVFIYIDTVNMMRGYIDNVEPYLEGADRDLWRLSGRDYGLDLAELFYTAPKGDYVNVRADDIINRAFTAVGTEITPPAGPFTAPAINYEWKPRTYLGDAVRDICKMVNYDFYVEDNVPRTLHFFSVGAAAEYSGVILNMIPNSLTNNILRLEMGERLGDNIKNYIVVSAGSLIDHWTDLNAADYTPSANVVRSDETTVFVEGKGSLKALSTANNNAVGITLDFTGGLYGYTSMDMSEPCIGRYAYLVHYPVMFPLPGIGTKRCYLELEDIGGTQIVFYRSITAGLSRNSDATQTGWNDFWQIVDKIPFGEQNIEAAIGPASTKGYWYYRLGANFDWTQVVKINFSTGGFPVHATDYFLVDSLMIPSVEVISIADAGVAANIRMKDEYRPDIRNQNELDSASAALLEKYRYNLEKLSLTTVGQTGSQYAGQSLSVRADAFGITPLTSYRVVNLHHMVRRTSSESDVPGWTFLTEYELIRNSRYGAGTQYYDSQRFLSSVDARQAEINRTRVVFNERRSGVGAR